eukprot:2757411-Alexandrium_andersonii.AAC.1
MYPSVEQRSAYAARSASRGMRMGSAIAQQTMVRVFERSASASSSYVACAKYEHGTCTPAAL